MRFSELLLTEGHQQKVIIPRRGHPALRPGSARIPDVSEMQHSMKK
jgi:hypothetical protein